MRTYIDIDDSLLAKAMKASGLSTKRAVVEEALKTLLRLHDQRGIRKLKGKIEWVGDLDEMRESRF